MGIGVTWEKEYKKDLKSGGDKLRADLLQLDNWRADYKRQYDERLADYNAGGEDYAIYRIKPTGNEYGPVNERVREFSAGSDLLNLQERIAALEYYDSRMPEAGQVRQAQRDLDATKAQIQARREDEHKKREELRKLRISPRDVKTTERGLLDGQ
jgi:hypothetical protein